jgi:hypothetical protein
MRRFALCVCVLVGLPSSGANAAEQCLRAEKALAAGSIAQTTAFVPVACSGEGPARAFDYDRGGHVTRLARALDKDEIVGRFPEFGEAVIEPGEALTLVIAAGSVRVERQVEALQEARAGERLFVRSLDGAVFAVRYEQVRP